MLKKIKLLMILSFTILIIAACSSNDNNEEKLVSNDEFMKEFAAGLEERWDFTEEEGDSEVTKDILLSAIELELEKNEAFKDLKFEDDKLKEYVILYVNELKNGIEVLDSFGADSFYEKWDEHYGKRTSLILEIDEAYDIEVSENHSGILGELKATGKEVSDELEREKEIDKFIETIEFELDQEQSDEYLKFYNAIVENITEYHLKDFSIDLKLIDSDGVTVATEYAFTNNWNKGDKAKLEFMTSEEFDKIDIVKSYIETE